MSNDSVIREINASVESIDSCINAYKILIASGEVSKVSSDKLLQQVTSDLLSIKQQLQAVSLKL